MGKEKKMECRKNQVLIIILVFFLLLPHIIEAGKVKLRVIVEKANIRLKPDLGSIIIVTIPMGAVIEADERIGEWFKVSLPPDEKGIIITGYVHSSMVEIVEEKFKKPVSHLPVPPIQPVQIKKAHDINFDLKLSAGINYLLYGDINEGVKGWSDFWEDSVIWTGYSVDGEAKSIHFGYDLECELIINFVPQIGIGLGFGYIHGTKKSEVTFTSLALNGLWINKPKVKTIPVKLGIFITLPMNDTMSIILNVGGGLYFANYSYNWRIEENGYWEEVNQEANAVSFGFHGGFGVEFKITPTFSFILENQGRYAKISGFKGKLNITDSYGNSHKEEGRLYYWNENSYTFVFIRGEKPSGANINNVREAEVNYSGFTFLMGIKIRF
jgi:hypothetical protein